MTVPRLTNEVLENAIMVHETCEKSGMEMQPLDAVAVQAMKELLKYRTIGTVEECRDAVEKQNRKPVENPYDTRYIWKSGYCPVCGCGVTARWDYCQCCGRKLSWENHDATK